MPTTWSQPNRECVGVAPMWNGDNVPNATGATAGAPGTWTPSGTDRPSNSAQATAWGVVASPTSAWTAGQYVQGATAGAPGEMTWTGSAWVGGRAPAEEPTQEQTPTKA
jgi:hypothetical protein